MTAAGTELPDEVPEAIAAGLERSDDAGLGAIVHYAHRLLRAQWESGIESEDGQYRWHYLGRIGTAGGE